jgi:hypothetical protein
VKQDYEYMLHRGNLGSIVGLDKPPGALFDRSIYEFATHKVHSNAFAERFVRTIKESCLDHLVLIGEANLQRATSQFVLHYHHERNHQSLENKILQPEFTLLPDVGAIQRRSRLGGLLNYYYREAA